MATALRGKTALITGAAKRIGRETALTLAEAGANVVIHYRHSAAEAEELAREVRTRGVAAWTIAADFTTTNEYDTLIERTLRLTGGFELLVNNASIFPPDQLENITFADLQANMEVNAWAPFVLCRAFAQQVGAGRIVNLLDSRLKGYDWTHVAYMMSKHVLAQFTRMMALSYAPAITVNGVAPGLILPPPGKDESYLEKLKNTVPLKRHGDPQDIADAVCFLLTSDFMTGEVIYVDGGRHLLEYIGGQNPH